MKTDSFYAGCIRNRYWIRKVLFAAIFFSIVLLLFISQNTFAQCTNYCSQGYATLDPSSADSLCFTIPSATGSAWVCLEVQLYFYHGAGCSDTANVDVAIYKKGTGEFAAPNNCVSPLRYVFQAGTPPWTQNCPNGNDIQCCCLPPGDYYIKILHYGANYAQCFTGHVEACIECGAHRCN